MNALFENFEFFSGKIFLKTGFSGKGVPPMKKVEKFQENYRNQQPAPYQGVCG